MKPLFTALLLLLPITIYASDHPAEEAEAKMEAAQKSLKIALQRIDKTISLIDDKEKQEATRKAFSDSQRKWKQYVDAEVVTFLAATPVPDTSTAAMLGAYYTETAATTKRVMDLQEFAEFLEANYK